LAYGYDDKDGIIVSIEILKDVPRNLCLDKARLGDRTKLDAFRRLSISGS
jgi:hypothetical protein